MSISVPGETVAPVSVIRPFEERDGKELQILIGMSVFEQLPVANQKAYLHPFVLATWIALSSALVQYMDWWPRTNMQVMPILGYLAPLPAFASVGVPVLFLVDWLQRPYFEKKLRQELTSEDILDVPAYYQSKGSRSRFSQFSVLEWKTRPIGYIALDATTPDDEFTNLEDQGVLPDTELLKVQNKKQTVTSTTTEEKDGRKTRAQIKAEKEKEKPKTKLAPRSVAPQDLPSHAVIRHFHVDRVYQQAGVQDDLANSVLAEVFSPLPPSASGGAKAKNTEQQQTIERVLVKVTNAQPAAEAMWRRLGFENSRTRTASTGKKASGSTLLFGVQERWLEITKAKWESLQA